MTNDILDVSLVSFSPRDKFFSQSLQFEIRYIENRSLSSWIKILHYPERETDSVVSSHDHLRSNIRGNVLRSISIHVPTDGRTMHNCFRFENSTYIYCPY